MPKKTIVLDYHACDPEQCENGICMAVLICKKRVLTQDEPYGIPDTNASMYLGCSLCVQACPKDALHVL